MERLTNITFEQLQTLHEVSRKINSQLNLPKLLDEIMDLAVALLEAEKGLILFRNEETGELEVQVARAPDKSTIENLIAMSRSTIHRVVEEGNPVFLGKVPSAPEDAEPTSLHRFQIKSVLCVPLRTRESLVGAIYLDTTRPDHFFRQDDLFFLEAFANLAGIAVENARSYQEVELLNKNLEKLVDERTQELRQKHKELKTAYQELKSTQLQLIRSEKMASLGMLVAGIAHEVNNPLGSISSNTDLFLRSHQKLKDQIDSLLNDISGKHPSEVSRLLNTMEDLATINKEACTRIMGIVKTMKNFARLDEMEVKSVDIHEGIDSTLEILSHLHREHIEIKKEYGDLPLLRCKASQLNQVFMNILLNAIQSIEEKGTITIRTYLEDDAIHVEIDDTGAGIPSENLEKIFDPGFTTKGVGVGTGLGLSIAYKIIEDHGGEIGVKSEPGRGSRFTIKLSQNGPVT
jgi:signal transduction histidine kinase